jgi:hypothetical protein
MSTLKYKYPKEEEGRLQQCQMQLKKRKQLVRRPAILLSPVRRLTNQVLPLLFIKENTQRFSPHRESIAPSAT